MPYCGSSTLVKDDTTVREARTLKCRCWHCRLCAPERQKDLRGLARRGAPTTFLTLTVNPSLYEDRDNRARQLARAWRLLRKRMEKRFNLKRIPYLAVFEETKRGEPHLHILLRLKFVPVRWISAQMKDLIGAPVVDIRRVVDQGGIARYVSKYIAKNPMHFEGCKRYWRSQNFELEENKYEKPPMPIGCFWSRVGIPLDAWISRQLALGHLATWTGRSWVVWKEGSG